MLEGTSIISHVEVLGVSMEHIGIAADSLPMNGLGKRDGALCRWVTAGEMELSLKVGRFDLELTRI